MCGMRHILKRRAFVIEHYFRKRCGRSLGRNSLDIELPNKSAIKHLKQPIPTTIRHYVSDLPKSEKLCTLSAEPNEPSRDIACKKMREYPRTVPVKN